MLRYIGFWLANMGAASTLALAVATPGDQSWICALAGVVLGFVAIEAGRPRT